MEQKATLKDLFIAPIKGLAFALFLPAIGLVMGIGLLATKCIRMVTNSFPRVAVFNWRPSESFLLGRPRKKDK